MGHACMQGRLRKDDIDARMAKALADLPSHLGMEAVDKFAMANLDTVRSKTGFMVSFLTVTYDSAMLLRMLTHQVIIASSVLAYLQLSC